MKQSTLEKIEEYKKELLEIVSDPILKRIINTYSFPNPVERMEDELDKILLEVLNEENQKSNNSGL